VSGGGVLALCAHVDDQRRVPALDQSEQFFGRDVARNRVALRSVDEPEHRGQQHDPISAPHHYVPADRH
jgi:hypothetical protein